MTSPVLCLVAGNQANVTACLLSQILSGRGRTALCALSARFDFELEPLLERLEAEDCAHIVVSLPEWSRFELSRRADTVVILDRSGGEAAVRLMAPTGTAVVNLDDPEGVPVLPETARRLTFSERRNEADLTAKNLRILPFRTEFEAVSREGICRLSVPLAEGQGLYPGLAAACAAGRFGVSLSDCARALRQSEPTPTGMTRLEGAGPYAEAGFFEIKQQ